MIWCNYGASYLTDSEMEAFLLRACQHLKENGVIIIKEVAIDSLEENNYLEEQQRLIRTQSQYEKLFKSLNTLLVHRFEPSFKEFQEFHSELIFVLQSPPQYKAGQQPVNP